MNTVEEHLEKARGNLAFLDTIEAQVDRFADWAVVVLFYHALHLASAAIHAQGADHGRSHDSRQRRLEQIISPAGAEEYERLYSRSRLYRYDAVQCTRSEYVRLRDTSFGILSGELRAQLGDLL